MREEGPEALPGIAAESRPYRVLRQSGMAITARNLARQHCADSAVDIPDCALDAHGLALRKRRLRVGNQLVVERLVEMMILPLAIVDRDPRFCRLLEQEP